jgi:hypothetical protein
VGDALQALAFAVLANERLPDPGRHSRRRGRPAAAGQVDPLGERAAVLAQLAHFIVDRES